MNKTDIAVQLLLITVLIAMAVMMGHAAWCSPFIASKIVGVLWEGCLIFLIVLLSRWLWKEVKKS